MTATSVPLERALPEAQETARRFFAEVPPTSRVVVFCHFDADGLGAGALFGRGLGRLGYTDVHVLPSGRGESAFGDGARKRLAALSPAALIVTDLGVDARGVLPDVPTLYVDHHQPAGEPGPPATVVSGYRWDPIPASSWLAYELLDALGDMDDLGWIGAVGTISDLGDTAPWPRLPEIKKRYTAKWLKEAVALVNAARRAPSFDVDAALKLLMAAPGPKELVNDDTPEAGVLRADRALVNAELAVARRAAPVFSETGPYALLRLHSGAQIHPLIAQQWRGRLPGHAVLAANSGYLPDTVAFAMRTARKDLNLPEILQGIDVQGGEGSYGRGHDQASGGQLPPEGFRTVLKALGFADDAL